MSPEQLHCLPVDHRTDIWSAGVVLYELLTRRSPFAGVSRADTIAAILEREPRPLGSDVAAGPRVLRELQRIIDRALQKDRDQRYQQAAEMLADLKAVDTADLSDISVPADLVSLADPTRTSRPLFNKSHLALVAIAIMLILTALFVYRQVALRSPSLDDVSAVVTRSYLQMSPAEQLAFINQQQQRISATMGDRPAKSMKHRYD